ncbi:Uncharacterised protein [Mycobacteroides abscessus subsp. abscessus]|nr:Uncharacterised protein [Mycobacteroides abscessus subsp. abscessus]SKU98509.1 Uncharacterised protein [Mycobacteroides abscessus subsp. abscessus]
MSGGLQNGSAAARAGVRAPRVGKGSPESCGYSRSNRIGNQHPGLGIEMYPPVAEGRVQTTHPGDVICHARHLRCSPQVTALNPSLHHAPTDDG